MYDKDPLNTNWKDNDDIVTCINDLWNRRLDYKNHLETEWYRNIAWFMGLQNLVYTRANPELHEIDQPPHRVRIVINRLQGLIRIMASKVYKAAPEWDVLPATTDATDLQIAQVNNRLLEYYWDKLEKDDLSIETIIMMFCTGNAFEKQFWDPDRGETIPNLNEFGEIESEDELFTGDVSIEGLSPFEMIVESTATNIREARWAMRSKVVNIFELKAQFPNLDIKQSRSGLFTNYFTYLEQLKTITSKGSRGNTLDKNSILVHEMWIKPGKYAVKDGTYCLVAGDTVLQKGPFPYIHKELPFCHYKEIDVPARFWATCTVSQLADTQAEYNRARSQVIESRNLMGSPKWLVPKGAGISKDSFDSEPGEIIEHAPGLAPRMESPPPMPSYIMNNIENAVADMEDISGVHDVSNAKAPGEVRGTGGILALIEQDETRLNLLIKAIERQQIRQGRQILHLIAQYTRETRLAKIVGANDELLLFEYSGSDLLGSSSTLYGANYFDVKIKTVSGLPNSRAAQQELLSLMIQNGVIKPAESDKDRRMALKLLSVGSVQDHMDEGRMHRSRQLQEIERLVRGEEVPAEEWHDHQVHIDVINQFRNSARYDPLSEEQRLALESHIRQHEEWAAYVAVKPQLMAQQAASLLAERQASERQGPGQELGGQGMFNQRQNAVRENPQQGQQP